MDALKDFEDFPVTRLCEEKVTHSTSMNHLVMIISDREMSEKRVEKYAVY